jgi:hypothetical protein
MLKISNLLINRINLRFNKDTDCCLNISKPDDFVLLGGSVTWTKGKLPPGCRSELESWLREQGIEDGDSFLCFDFSWEENDNGFSVRLDPSNIEPFKNKIFLQELSRFFIERGFLIEPLRMVVDFSVYQHQGDFSPEWEQYRRIDLKWNKNREELSFNIGSKKTLISRQRQAVINGTRIVNEENQLIYRADNDEKLRKIFNTKRIHKGPPEKFNYYSRYEDLKKIAFEYLNAFHSKFFTIDKSGLKSAEPGDVQTIFSRQNLMAFGGGKTSVNAALGMREFGPFRKIENANSVKLLFIYQNRDEANNLYLFLRNGLKHFPGLLSYTGIPVALDDDKRLNYISASDLPDELRQYLSKEYPEDLYPDTLAIVIGPFRKYESEEEESETYYQVKKLLLSKGISSQFVSNQSIKEPNFHYALPNIAIAILAKLGGIPWKLDTKRYNELIIGFNTKKYGENTFLGSAVFFDNEGKIGRVQGFPQASSREIIQHLRNAIVQYNDEFGEPDRLVIHYYKPPQTKVLKSIEFLLKEELNLPIPFAVVEVNDSKTKMEICFDADYSMGMPESGTYVRVGWNEYLLFNNNRYQKKPARRIEEVLPIKVKISFADTGGFHHKELITQVYEFSRIYWKGLKQRSQPVTTEYSKLIADFSSKFGGDIPKNSIAQTTPWFI